MGTDNRKVKPGNMPIVATFAYDERRVIAEKVLLGAMLREPYNMHTIIDRLNETALAAASDGRAECFAAVVQQFKQRGTYSISTVEAATGNTALAHMASENTDVPLDFALDNYTDEHAIWAEINAMQVACGEENVAMGAAAMRAAAEVARQKLGANEAADNADGRAEFETWLKDRVEGKEETFLCRPPVRELRKIVNGWRPAEMIIIAARPGMGKTQLALNCLVEMEAAGAKGLFFSLEMLEAMLLQRLMGIKGGINPRGDLRGIDKLYQVGKEVLAMDIKIIDNIFSIDGIERRAIAESYRGKLDYIIVDYLQLITWAAPRGTIREQVVSHISGALTRLAKRLKVPVIVLSQLSRDVEKRGGAKRPMLSDLRESGSLEQDASVVLFPYRPEYYGIMEDECGQSLQGIGELIVAKQRNGDTGTARCAYDPIRGYKDEETSTQFPTTSIPAAPATDYVSHRPKADEDIPF